MLPSLAHARDTETSAPVAIDTEHIFGFAEGADIGEKGEKELEITATGLAGKLGQYVGVQNETALRYGVADDFRASLGVLTDYHALAGVPDLADLHSLNVFGGVSSEFRWQVLNRFSSPLDLTLLFEPQWQHIDDLSGQSLQAYVLPVKLLADFAVVPERTFVALNFSYEPAFTRIGGTWQRDNPIEISLSASTAIAGNAFLGAEIPQLILPAWLFLGPGSLYWAEFVCQTSDVITVKVAWEAQIPAETAGRDDLGKLRTQPSPRPSGAGMAPKPR